MANSTANRFFTADAFFDQTRFDENLMTVTAHELTHLLIEKKVGEFDQNEHVIRPTLLGIPLPIYNAELMYQYVTKENRELATVTIFPVVQQELWVKSNQGI